MEGIEFSRMTSCASCGALSRVALAALQVLTLLGQRPGEVAGMHRSEIIYPERPAEARWEIPAARMKGRRPHVVPLPERARQIIAEQALQPDRVGDFIFASKFAHR